MATPTHTTDHIHFLHENHEGIVFVCHKSTGSFSQEPFPATAIDEIADRVLFLDQQGQDVWLSVASFDGETRRAEEVRDLNVLIAEYDCGTVGHKGANAPFETVEEALACITAQFEAAGVMPTRIVHSGHGLHCYWKVGEALGDWNTTRYNALNEELFQLGLPPEKRGKFRNECKDKSRILRLPGTRNHKETGNPRPIEAAFTSDEVYDLSTLLEAAASAFPEQESHDEDRPDVAEDVSDPSQNSTFLRARSRVPGDTVTFIQSGDLDRLGSDGDPFTSSSEKEHWLVGHLMHAHALSFEEIAALFEVLLPSSSHYQGLAGAEQQEHYLRRSFDRFDNEDYRARRLCRKFPFIQMKQHGGGWTIDQQSLLNWFHDNIERFSQHLAIIDGTPRIWDGRMWKVCTDSDVQGLIFDYFNKRGLRLKSSLLKELRAQLDLRTEEVESQASRDYRHEIVIPFRNGTLYLSPTRLPDPWARFEAGKWDKGSYCTFLVEADFEPWMLSEDRWRESIIGKYFDEFYRPADVAAIQVFLASVFIPELNHQKALFIIGRGSNGKGVLAETFQGLLAPESVSSLNVSSWGTAHENVAMINSVFNVSNEITSRELGTEAFKSVIAQDPMTFNPKFERTVLSKPRAKQLFTINTMPRMAIGYAEKRRMILVQAVKHVPLDQQTPLFKLEFEQHAPQLLNFALRGIEQLVASDFAIRHENAELAWDLVEANEAAIAEFIQNCLIHEPGSTVGLDAIYDAFRAWKSTNSVPGKDVGKATFSKKLSDVFQVLGWDVERDRPRDTQGRRPTVFTGLRLKDNIADPYGSLIKEPARNKNRPDGRRMAVI